LSDSEVVVPQNAIHTRLPARSDPETSGAFGKRQRDAAYHGSVERYVAWAIELLDATPDVIDSPMIRERRAEAAAAVLDVLWAVIAERNAMEGEPHPVPGLIWHRFAEERLGRRSAS
jgi:hypothetical protein